MSIGGNASNVSVTSLPCCAVCELTVCVCVQVASAAPPAAGCSRLAESTPDLVLDLPARDAADTFAHNRDTLRKRPAPASPVPARNTARVAAKFAELTLTGGSLKPALAAKPALLRRPTPHPHARAPPAPPAAPPALPAPAAAPPAPAAAAAPPAAPEPGAAE
ncbi:uncharacterized protein [Epargyreus clarus]|uniref:uncharacterized protein n=1 Tax=Epargyreus clarus TaxID=520877 RepID=UPI003C2BEC16